MAKPKKNIELHAKRVTFCIPKTLLAQVNEMTGAGSTRSGVVCAALTSALADQGFGEPPILRNVQTIVVSMPPELVENLAAERRTGESRSRQIVRLLQIYFGF